MAFVLLLLLSLSALVRVELSGALRNSKQETARQNAIFALNVALGKLQRLSGPDQRITATASILGSDSYYAGEEGISNVADYTQHWVGVWAPNGYDPNRDASEMAERRFLGWLVSGSAANVLSYVNHSPSRNSVGQEPAILVGDHTVQPREGQSEADVEVRAEVVPIFNDDNLAGGYAFWIGDESVKAKLSVIGVEAYDNASVGSWENVMAALQGNPAYSRIGATDSSDGPFAIIEDISEDVLSRVHATSDFPLLDEGLSEDIANKYYHELTSLGAGLLTDAQNGGLRRDLTSMLGVADNFTDKLKGKRIFWFNNAKAFQDLPQNTRTNIRHPYSVNWDVLFHYYVWPLKIHNPGQDNEYIKGMARHQWPESAGTVIDGIGLNTQESRNWFDFTGRNLYYGDVLQNTRWYKGYYESLNDHKGETFFSLAPYIIRAQVTYRLEAVYANAGEDNMLGTLDDSYSLRVHQQPAFVLYNPYNIAIDMNLYPSHAYSNYFQFKGTPHFQISVYEDITLSNRKFINQFKPGALQAQYVTIDENVEEFRYGLSHEFSSGYTSGLFNAFLEPGEIVIYSPDIASGTVSMDSLNTGGGLYGGEIPMSSVEYAAEKSAYWEEIYIDLDDNGLYDDYPLPDSDTFLHDALHKAYSSVKEREDIDWLTWPPAYGTAYPTQADYMQLDDLIQVTVDFNQVANGEYAFGYSAHPQQFHGWSIIQQHTVPSASISNPSEANGTVPALTVADLVGNPRTLGTIVVKLKPGAADLDTDPNASFVATANPVRVLSDYNFRVFRDEALVAPYLNGELHTMFVCEFVVGDGDTSIQHEPANHDAKLNGYWGAGLSIAEGTTHVTLFDLPREPLVSLAQFQHASLGVRSTEPSYMVGNSQLPPWMPADKTIISHSNDISPAGSVHALASVDRMHIDASYYVNDALFDEYFFSTVPVENLPSRYFLAGESFDQDYIDNDKVLPSSRIRFMKQDGIQPSIENLRDPLKSAAYLFIDGPFNVNSTSVEAWKAVIASVADLSLEGVSGSGTTEEFEYLLPRTPRPYLGYEVTADSDIERFNQWNGIASLSEEHIHQLAEAIVEQIKIRGPFLSLAQFINRNVIAAADDVHDTRFGGALQQALDNNGFSGGGINQEYISHNTGYNGSSGLSDSYSRNAPGWISQADLLTPMAPFLSVRSDTFVIRCYGEVRNPLTGEIDAKAIGEAVVQRFPDYMDATSNEAWDTQYLRNYIGSKSEPNWIENPDFEETNIAFGRKYRIVAFRWLTEA